MTDLDVRVSLDGVVTKDYELKTTTNSVIVRLTNAQKEDALVSLKSYSATGTPSNKGFWDMPISSTSNPYNKQFTEFTFGDIIRHYNTAIENHPNSSGENQGVNNSRDINSLFSYGSQIAQHSTSLPLASVLIRDNLLSITKSLRFAGKEYEKLKNNVINTANKITLNGTVAQQLDDILIEINKNKDTSFAFVDTDMLGYGSDKKELSYTVADANIKNYPMTADFGLETLSNKAVYVYVNDEQLVHGKDYTFTDLQDSSNIVGIEITSTLSVNDKIKIHEYNNTTGSFVPATPAKLGLAPAYEPRKLLDDTYQSGDSSQDGINVIEGHDGSIVVAYDDFRDDLLLEFEKRIYNNIKTSYDCDQFDYFHFYQILSHLSCHLVNLILL